MTKSIKYRHFDYCNKDDIEIFNYNIDSMLIRESDPDKMKSFIANDYGYCQIDSRYNEDVIISEGVFSLDLDDINKIRNMT
jgi:hypothetical protein